MPANHEGTCPGCGLRMPASERVIYDGYYNTSPECWSVYTEVIGREFSHAVLYGQVHQLTVDAYAVQHAGGHHPDKSVDIHLAGLYLVLESRIGPPRVPKYLQRLAAAIETWPHFPPPVARVPLTAFDVAISESLEAHVNTVRAWARAVWQDWSPHHAAVAELLSEHLGHN